MPKAWERGQSVDYDNRAIRAYYSAQHICPEEELDAMWEAFKKELPASFRLTCTGDLYESSQKYYAQEAVIESEGTELDRPKPLPWLNGAFRMTQTDRQNIRKNQSAKKFKQRLVNDFERGAIQRQEIVSMIPPLFLKCTDSDTVVDMCAAPGSKTSQMIDSIHIKNKVGNGQFVLPHDAAVLANDVSIERARLLSHQLGKISSPVVATICSDASALPKAHDPRHLFSKVLCDVPCSGDGTLRKNIDIWNTWNVKSGLGLHDRQLKILVRGLELLAPGGRLVYSTCSLNPIEDEAVVAAALQHFGLTDLRLIDALDEIDLPAGRGVKHWRVPNARAFYRFAKDEVQEKVALSSGSEAAKRRRHGKKQVENVMSDEEKRAQVEEFRTEVNSLPLFWDQYVEGVGLCKTMFPEEFSDEIREMLPMTARFMPHRLNSGGFFVAVFERKSESDACLKKWKRLPDSADKPVVRTTDDTVNVEPLTKAAFDDIVDFYGLSGETVERSDRGGEVMNTMRLNAQESKSRPDCKPVGDIQVDTNSGSTFLYQKSGCTKRVYLATPRLYEMYKHCESLNFISFGSKVLERLDDRFCSTSGCDWRLTNDAAVWLSGYMRKRVVMMDYKSMKECLERDGLTRPYLLELEESGAVWNLDSCRNAAGLMISGGCVIVAEGEELGAIRVAALLTANGNIQPLMKKCIRDGVVAILEGREGAF